MTLKAVREGEIVDVIAPASRCSAEDLRNGLNAITALGLVPRLRRPLFARSVLFSNTDERRLADLKAALYAPDSNMVWCVRGGYGSLRLVPEMARWKRPARPKLFLGYSDITTLHAFLNAEWGWPTLHGPLLDRFGRGVQTARERREILDLIFGRVTSVVFPGLEPMNRSARTASRVVRGPVVGGNMAVLQSGMGTPWQLNPRGKILFLEDTGERPHRVDRMLTQFDQAGWFRGARALVLGHFQLGDPKDRRPLWEDVFARFAEAQKIPVVKGLPVGHDQRHQATLPLNTSAELRLGRSVRLAVASGL